MEFLVLLAVLLFVANHLTHGELVKMGKNFLSESDKVKELTGPKPQTDPLQCEVYEERLVDLKMVKAGIMKPNEVAQCDNLRCGNCH